MASNTGVKPVPSTAGPKIESDSDGFADREELLQRDWRRLRLRSRPLEIAAIYAVFGLLWIFFSDSLLARLVVDPVQQVAWGSYKGFAFIAVTAGLLWLLLTRAFAVIGEVYTALDTKDRALRDAQHLADTMNESIPGVIYFYDSQGNFLNWNKNFELATGFSSAEISQMRPRDFIATADRSRVDRRIEEVFTAGDSAIEAGLLSKDGRSTPYFFTGRRVTFDGKPCLVGVGIDVSARKLAEREAMGRLQAEAADRVKSAFLATMSHELRTPLNSIIGFTGIILQGLAGPLNVEQTKQLEMVRGSARHLLALVNDVLDISKIEAGQLEISREPFDVQRSLNKVLAIVEPLAAAKGLELAVESPAELGEAIGDERRFEQILLNLLSNAIKFTDRGRVTLAAEPIADYRPDREDRPCDGSEPSQPPSSPALRLRVSDTGIGIKPENLSCLFQPFRQIDSGITRTHDGTGLGLAICSRLTRLMGGEISAQSEWLQGSTFTVTIPMEGPLNE